MRRSFLISTLILTCLAASPMVLAEKGCEFNIVGTWQNAEQTASITYHFSPDGTVKVLSGSGPVPQEIARATYKLDNARAPKVITFTASEASGLFDPGATSMELTGYSETSFTCLRPGSSPTRWVRIEPHQYFIVLAGRSGTFYDQGGATFSMLIKRSGQITQVNAVGIYSVRGSPVFGPVPPEAYKEFLTEPRSTSDVMLRLEITAAQYQRALNILETWERRVREEALLYPEISLNNVLLVKQVTETLNQCRETLKLYKLDWGLDDHISENNPPSRAPFLYFKELRRLNESLHVSDERFREQGLREQKAVAH